MEIRKFTREMPIPFEDGQFQQLAEDLADLNHQLKELKEEKKESSAGFKRRIDAIQEEIDSKSDLIQEGGELKEIDLIAHLDVPEEGKKTIFRNGKNIGVEDMTQEDRQREMPLEPDNPFELGGEE